MATVERQIDYESWVNAALRAWANQLDDERVQVVRITVPPRRLELYLDGERVATITVTPER